MYNCTFSHPIWIRHYIRCGVPTCATLCPFEQRCWDSVGRLQIRYSMETTCCFEGSGHRYVKIFDGIGTIYLASSTVYISNQVFKWELIPTINERFVLICFDLTKDWYYWQASRDNWKKVQVWVFVREKTSDGLCWAGCQWTGEGKNIYCFKQKSR